MLVTGHPPISDGIVTSPAVSCGTARSSQYAYHSLHPIQTSPSSFNVYSWLKSLGLPLTFAELGAKEEDIPLLVKTLNLCGNTLGGFQPLTEDDVAAIYRLCLSPA